MRKRPLDIRRRHQHTSRGRRRRRLGKCRVQRKREQQARKALTDHRKSHPSSRRFTADGAEGQLVSNGFLTCCQPQHARKALTTERAIRPHGVSPETVARVS